MSEKLRLVRERLWIEIQYTFQGSPGTVRDCFSPDHPNSLMCFEEVSNGGSQKITQLSDLPMKLNFSFSSEHQGLIFYFWTKQ